jgi:diguanylate cyclase (GGDEF)-like protein/PAS domain S-box-containing protein
MLPYVFVTAGLIAAYFAVPAWHAVMWGSIGLTGTVAIAVGTAWNRPRRPVPWILVCTGSLAFTASIVTGQVLALLGQVPFPSIADLLALAVFMPLMLGGLLSLTRSGAAVRDRASAIDALMLTVGAGFLSWIFLINPYLQNPHLTTLEKTISVAYPSYDILVLAILARMAVSVQRTTSVALLLLAGTGLLVSDALFGLATLNGSWHPGGPTDLGWILFFAGLGAAALDGSMTRLTEPRVLRRTTVAVRRTLVTVASLIAPSVLLAEALRGAVRDGVVIALVSGSLVLLAMARLSIVAAGLRQSVARERELRRACETLLSSTDADEVSEVMHTAVAHLLPPRVPHHVVLSMVDTRPGSRDWMPEAAPEPGGGGMSMTAISTLPRSVAARLGDSQYALRYVLTVGERQIGALYVAADDVALVTLQDALPVLAGQAATILDRIRLNHEINQRNNESYFKTLVLNANDVILIVGEGNRVRYASPSGPSLFGRDDLLGVPLLDLIEREHRPVVAGILGSARANENYASPDWLIHRASGVPVHVEVSIRDLRVDPTVGGLVLTMRDVTEQRRLEQELIRRAYIDPLTGLGNRTRFQERVSQVAGNARRTRTMAGVLLVNLDDFKVVNDTMGNDSGDELLVAVGRRLVETTGREDAVARLAADEFGVVVENCGHVDAIEVLAGKIVSALAVPFPIGAGSLSTRARVGYTTTADNIEDDQLLSQADLALDAAKRDPHHRWRRYESALLDTVLERVALHTDLERALAGDGELFMNYQPIVDLPDGRTRGLEALVRWKHPERGLIPPMMFIPIAEESGLILQLGAWVMSESVGTAAAWHRELPTDSPSVSVNVSARQFRAPDFLDQVLALLNASGLPPRLLVLEITESLLLHDDEQVAADLARLREMGVRVAIDDFGTGYSSLSYLHRVPIDTVKLDKSFVDNISTSVRQFDLIKGIVQLAGTLGLDVVAEGIETATDRRLLIDAGCPYGQGYLFSRPMSHDDATAWVRAGTRPLDADLSVA